MLMFLLSNPVILTAATLGFLAGVLAHSLAVVAIVKHHRRRASAAAWPRSDGRDGRPRRFVTRLDGGLDGR